MITIQKAVVSSVAAMSEIATSSFMEAVAPLYRPHGISAFRNYAGPGCMAERMALGNVFYTACDGSKIIGMAEVIPAANHLAMLFVVTERQRQGIGRALLARLKEDMMDDNGIIQEITVDAAPNSVGAYEHFRFSYKGSLRELGGILFFPMILSFAEINYDRQFVTMDRRAVAE